MDDSTRRGGALEELELVADTEDLEGNIWLILRSVRTPQKFYQVNLSTAVSGILEQMMREMS